MNKTFLWSIIAALTIVIILLFAKVYINQQMIQTDVLTTVSPTLTPTIKEQMTFVSPTPVPTNENGTIEGSLSYPSEGIPENMTVCAESNDLEDPICTSAKITDAKYTYGKGYKLEVPAGTYLVYAKLDGQEYRAYYNKFVICGLLASCTDHTPIEVKVTANQTTSKIDPQDWYNSKP
jgi:hypothetical protein